VFIVANDIGRGNEKLNCHDLNQLYYGSRIKLHDLEKKLSGSGGKRLRWSGEKNSDEVVVFSGSG
jgi:hypothetical protein